MSLTRTLDPGVGLMCEALRVTRNHDVTEVARRVDAGPRICRPVRPVGAKRGSFRVRQFPGPDNIGTF
jgi:hypothetical protein